MKERNEEIISEEENNNNEKYEMKMKKIMWKVMNEMKIMKMKEMKMKMVIMILMKIARRNDDEIMKMMKKEEMTRWRIMTMNSNENNERNENDEVNEEKKIEEE